MYIYDQENFHDVTEIIYYVYVLMDRWKYNNINWWPYFLSLCGEEDMERESAQKKKT
jgi:hypothetical protein